MDKFLSQLPDQTGKIAVVTGGGSGIGLAVARGLIARGARVIVASRQVGLATQSGAEFMKLDLGDTVLTKQFAEQIQKTLPKLDYLICNAGIMMPAQRQTTGYGVEAQFGVNYLGHFALIAHLLPLLKKSKTRIVTISSVANRPCPFDLGEVWPTGRYRPFRSYALSKLACLMLALELAQRSQRGHWDISAVAAHPGLVHTRLFGGSHHPFMIFSNLGTRLVGQSAARAARTVLFATTSPNSRSGGYYGPKWLFFGNPHPARPPKNAHHAQKRHELWQLSEKITGLELS